MLQCIEHKILEQLLIADPDLDLHRQARRAVLSVPGLHQGDIYSSSGAARPEVERSVSPEQCNTIGNLKDK